jgi:PrcB C-terminal
MSKLFLAVIIVAGGATFQTMPFTTIAAGQQSGIENHREIVVRTAADWKGLWKEHSPNETVPAIDFSKSVVAGVFLGLRNTGGHRVTISSVDRQGKGLVVAWREQKPAPDTVVIQMVTFPFVLVRIDDVGASDITFRRVGG